ncbi:uncharacterized protein SPSK_06556 [Sporothrix schenckii 1099-18]|uniref:J domain-containing protein n=1 Tax=Sporothrix schenckii 1099-18 TaxID=1397361 RepID=A0A0F2MM50_SPOSC|nr:uncharacterized protein SPSK_06556 [Sporothrix schenckii 1099-18]KJR89256.1 hypothetical protein SPSK_06556 [Sporothrix schenckii 1099-18]
MQPSSVTRSRRPSAMDMDVDEVHPDPRLVLRVAEDDYYEILQVSPSASKKVIKAASDALRLMSQPTEECATPEPTANASLMLKAQRILLDDHARQAYDRHVLPGVLARRVAARRAVPANTVPNRFVPSNVKIRAPTAGKKRKTSEPDARLVDLDLYRMRLTIQTAAQTVDDDLQRLTRIIKERRHIRMDDDSNLWYGHFKTASDIRKQLDCPSWRLRLDIAAELAKSLRHEQASLERYRDYF